MPAPGSFLSALGPQERGDLFARGRPRRYRGGTTLFSEGDTADRVIVLLSGRVKVSYTTDEGDEILLAIRGLGELLGELSVLDGEPRSATVTALEAVDALVVGAAEFRTFLRTNPAAAMYLLTTLSRRLRDADRKRIEFRAFDILARVAGRLVELAENFGEASEHGVYIALSLTQEDLAGWVGGSREAVSKALRVLRAGGLIETRRGAILVLDLEALRRRAN